MTGLLDRTVLESVFGLNMCNMGREIVLIWQMEVVEMRHAKGLEQDLAQRGLGNGGSGPSCYRVGRAQQAGECSSLLPRLVHLGKNGRMS